MVFEEFIMIYISLLTIVISLLLYLLIGNMIVSEKNIFNFQFLYIVLYFLIAPALHVIFNIYASDFLFYSFEEALISLNTINSVGIIFMLFGLVLSRKIILKPIFKSSNINWKLLFKISSIYIAMSTIYYVYLVMTTNVFFLESQIELENTSLLRYMILESTPIVFAWQIISYLKINKKNGFIPYFLLFSIIAIVFGGLRGSRVTIIFNIISFLVLYIYIIRTINFKYLLPLMLIGFLFNSIYSNYKYSGIEGIKTYITTGQKSDFIEEKDNATLHFILSDLSRTDVQAKIVENFEAGDYTPPYNPETYISALLLVFPDEINNPNIRSKRILGTDAIYGFEGNDFYSSSRIYGLVGESILNFGLYLLPFSFIMFGMIHGLSNKYIYRVKKKSYVLFLPLLFFFPIYLLFYDFDNIVFQVIKNWFIPLMIFILYNFLNKSSMTKVKYIYE